jgi:hypothetical protein
MYSLHNRTSRYDDWTIRLQTKNVYMDTKKITQLNACLQTGSVVIILKCNYVLSICHHNTPYVCVGYTFSFRSRPTCVTFFISLDWPCRPVKLPTVHVRVHADLCHTLQQCFSTAGPRPGTGPGINYTGPGINYTGPRKVLLEFFTLVS